MNLFFSVYNNNITKIQEFLQINCKIKKKKQAFVPADWFIEVDFEIFHQKVLRKILQSKPLCLLKVQALFGVH